MTELIIKIVYDDSDCYNGCGDDTTEIIKNGIEQFMQIDLKDDGIIKDDFSVEIITTN